MSPTETSQPLRILLINDKYPPEPTTVGTLVHADAQALSGLGHTVAVLTSADIATPEKKTEGGVEIYRMPRSLSGRRLRSWISLYHPRMLQEARRVLKEFRPDVVHCHNIHQHISYGILLLARRCGARVFLTMHDVMSFHYGKLTEFIDPAHPVCKAQWDYRVTPWQQMRRFGLAYNPFRNFFIRRALQNADMLFAVSHALKEALEQNGIRGARVLYNGIDPMRWQVSGETTELFRQKYRLENNKVIFFGGRISPLKGAEALLNILEKVVAQVPEAMLMIVGKKTPYVESLLTRAQERGFGKNIFCTGWLSGEELRAAYGVSTIVAVPSLCFDSFPTTLLEAAAIGKPAIASCWGGMAEIIIDGKTGYLVHPIDTTGCAETLAQLIDNHSLKVSMGAAARLRVEQNFSLAKHIAEINHAYVAALK